MRHLRWILVSLLPIILVALFFPWPSPRPLPFSSVQVEAGGGSREYGKIQIYTSSLSVATLKNYYNFQLWFFCNDWYWWEVTPDEILTHCTFSKQTFSLSLKSQANGKILVTQTDRWIEP